MTTPAYSLKADIMGRVAPFLALLDARFLPLLLLGAPQSYNVYLWLVLSGSSHTFAVLGAAGFESAYIGVIAWADSGTKGKQSGWMITAAIAALLFSVLVAVYVHMPSQGWWSLLHAGFPLVACLYTVAIHASAGAASGATKALPAPSEAAALPICAYEGCTNEASTCEHGCGVSVCSTHKGNHNQWRCTHYSKSRAFQEAPQPV